jgi:hypothetical protein
MSSSRISLRSSHLYNFRYFNILQWYVIVESEIVPVTLKREQNAIRMADIGVYLTTFQFKA